MSISGISAAGLAQYVLSSSNSTPLQQAVQTLKNSLASGDLNGASSAFQTVLQLVQNSATATGSSTNSRLFTDLSSLGSAISSGDLASAQSAFATVQSDLQNSSPTQTAEINEASQSVQLVQELLSTVSSNSQSTNTASADDQTTSVLDAVYGSRSGLNMTA
jgi:ribosomal protein S20